jgi:hypothetical protein
MAYGHNRWHNLPPLLCVLVQSLWTDDPSNPQTLLGVYSSPLPKSLLFFCIIHLLPCTLCHHLPILRTCPLLCCPSPKLSYLLVQIQTLLLQQPNSPLCSPLFPIEMLSWIMPAFLEHLLQLWRLMVDIQGCMDSGFTCRRSLAFLPTISNPALPASTSELSFHWSTGWIGHIFLWKWDNTHRWQIVVLDIYWWFLK